MQEAPNPATENATAEPHDPEGIDAAAAAFAQADAQPEAEQDDSPADEPADSDDTEATEADPEAEEDAEALAEVEYEGKTYKVPPELEKAILRQSDYSRAMNEVSAKEKAYTQRLEQIETITEGADKYAEALSGVRMIEAQLAQFEGIDWQQIGEQNPGEAARLAVRQLQLQQALDKASTNAKSIGQSLAETRERLRNEARGDMFKALSKSLKGWGDEMGAKLTEYATKNGVNVKTLQDLTDPGVVIALDKARKYDELQASKTAIKAKVQSAPQVTKPGAPRGKPDAKNEAMARLRKSNSIDDAAAAFLAVGR